MRTHKKEKDEEQLPTLALIITFVLFCQKSEPLLDQDHDFRKEKKKKTKA